MTNNARPEAVDQPPRFALRQFAVALAKAKGRARGSTTSPRASGRYLAGSLFVFTLLTAAMTVPQVLHLADAVHDDGDPLLNAWTLAWVAHQLPRAPAHLFDANIFHPERHALAFSETLLVPAAVAAPLHWFGIGPILVHNLVFLSGFIVSGAGTALLVRTLTGSGGAGIVAGLIFAFLPYRIDHYPHLQLQQTQCLPFAFWAFHRLVRSGRVRDGALFGAFTAGQVLSCTYYGLFLVPYMAVVCGTILISGRLKPAPTHGPRESVAYVGSAFRRTSGRTSPRLWPGVLVAAFVVAAAVLPVGRAYLGARALVGERGPAEVATGSATMLNYLGPPAANALWGTRLARFANSERRLFPGFLAMALAAVGLWPRRGEPRIDPARWAYALGLLLALDVSLGFNGISYRVLYDYFIPFRALRIPARMGIIVGFSLAVLAGYGAARLAAWTSSPRARAAVLTTMGALMLVEYASKPIALQPIPLTPPSVYTDLIRDRGDSPDAVIAEYPLSPHDDPTYMYYSTFHWQRLVNGYSGFFPRSYLELSSAMEGFPGEHAIGALRARGVRYLLVHQERMIGDRYVRMIPVLDRRSDLRLIVRGPGERYGQHGEISLYRVLYSETR